MPATLTDADLRRLFPPGHPQATYLGRVMTPAERRRRVLAGPLSDGDLAALAGSLGVGGVHRLLALAAAGRGTPHASEELHADGSRTGVRYEPAGEG